MPSPTSAPRVQLRLRGGAEPLFAEVVWPAGDTAGRSGVLVLLVEPGATRPVEPAPDVLTFVAGCRSVEDGLYALEWIADHAAQLGADGDRLLLSGGTAVSDAVAARARETGWPRIARPVLRRTTGT
jgi:hypothetical protein